MIIAAGSFNVMSRFKKVEHFRVSSGLFIYAFFAVVLEKMTIFTFVLASVLIKINKNEEKRGNEN